MTLKNSSRRLAAGVAITSALTWALACGSPSSDAVSGGVGGSSGAVGLTAGAIAKAGAPSGTGGTPASGGALSPSGGTSATGGAPSSGGNLVALGGAGTPSLGGTAAGGQNGTGGNGGGGASTTAGVSAGGAAAGSPAAGAPSGGSGGKGTAGSTGATASGGSGGASNDPLLAKFSFFVVSYPAIISLSGKAEGFGGDLRFGKTDGLSGADEICRRVAEMGLPGAGQKTWRAFLSVSQGPGGAAVNARDRIGSGPWYDRLGRLFASNVAGLFSGDRPAGDAAVVDDFPNENGQPNHYVGASGLGTTTVDNHDTLTGSDTMGRLIATTAAQTCNDWTSTTAQGTPRVGHSWPRSGTAGRSWVSDHTVPGCIPGVDRTLGGTGSGSCVGCSGGYGGFYCFALP